MDVTNPATGALLATLPVDDAASVAAKHARLSSSSWGAAPQTLAERAAVLAAFRGLLAASGDALPAVMAREMGKPLAQGRETVGACDYRIQWFLENAGALLDEEQPNAAGAPGDAVRYEPAGVVGFLPAFNFPTLMLVDFLVPALLLGNTVLMKPSEHATQTALDLAQLLYAAGVPEDALQVVCGGPAVGAAVVAAPLDGLVFIGSTATGGKIAAAPVSPRRTVLEMGGNDGFFVAPDVEDVGATAALLATGKVRRGARGGVGSSREGDGRDRARHRETE